MKENHIQISLPLRVIERIEEAASKKGVSKGIYVKMLLLDLFDKKEKPRARIQRD